MNQWMNGCIYRMRVAEIPFGRAAVLAQRLSVSPQTFIAVARDKIVTKIDQYVAHVRDIVGFPLRSHFEYRDGVYKSTMFLILGFNIQSQLQYFMHLTRSHRHGGKKY